MKKLVINSSYAFLYLNKELYSQNALRDALEDFKEFIIISSKEFNSYFSLKIEAKTNDYSIQELTHEFLNYLTGIEFEMEGLK